jgi:hypothetical protein
MLIPIADCLLGNKTSIDRIQYGSILLTIIVMSILLTIIVVSILLTIIVVSILLTIIVVWN